MSDDHPDFHKALVDASIQKASESLTFIAGSIMVYRGAATYDLEQAVQHAETAYLETYLAWQVEKANKAAYQTAHERARLVREKMQLVKKLLDELECEAERVLQSVPDPRT